MSGTFQLYTIPVIADFLLPLLLEECSHRFPAMKVHTSMLSMSKLPDLIIPKDADLILGINISGLLDSSIQKSGLFMEPLFTGNSYLVVGKNHPLAHKKITTRSEMLEQQLIIHYNGFDLDLLYNALLDTPHPVNVLFRSNNTRLITQTLENHAAFCRCVGRVMGAHIGNSGNGCNIDNLSVTLFFHDFKSFSGAVKYSVKINLDIGLPLFIGQIFGNLQRVFFSRQSCQIQEVFPVCLSISLILLTPSTPSPLISQGKGACFITIRPLTASGFL